MRGKEEYMPGNYNDGVEFRTAGNKNNKNDKINKDNKEIIRETLRKTNILNTQLSLYKEKNKRGMKKKILL